MWLFSFITDTVTSKKSPQEILEDKYLELIDTNGIDKLQKNPSWFNYSDKTYYSWVIAWVKWVQILVYCEIKETMWWYDAYSCYKTDTSYYYWWWIGKIECSWDFAEKIWNKMNNLYYAEESKKKEEAERIKEKAEEANRLAKDKIFIEEYNRLCWSTWEFNKQFKLLDEIESLGKEQIKLLEKWEENKNLIYEKREKFYSLTK